jgi:hypothetical protein
MLTEIKCSHFIENSIQFTSGLNTVLGDNISTNSIGKSTLLMIIDFVFGGSTYTTKDSGSIKELGHHSFCFKFEFEGVSYYYQRNTENKEFVSICDEGYNILSEITIEQFRKFLKSNYKISNKHLSFRSLVSPYSRIWGKENYNVDKPLQAFPKEADSDSITNLIKLFDLYNVIAETEIKIKNQEESKKILNGIHKRNYVQKISKTEFLKNQLEIEQIKNSIDNIKDNLLRYTLNIEELKTDEVIELKTEKSKLLQVQSGILNKIKRLELNLEQKSVKSKYFNKLSTFFENTNENRISEIETFHNKIGQILTREIKVAKALLEKENDSFNTQIEKIDAKINYLLQNAESPKFIVDKLYDLTIKLDNLTRVNKFYQEKEDVVSDIKTLNANLETTISEILKRIQELINEELIKINSEIYSKNKKTPTLILKQNSYKFDHSGDTGTGKSYSDLIEFDLVVLKLTVLPIVIHDSPLFKNIGDLAFDKIIKQYSSFDKQIFISVDGINKYSPETMEILENKKAIQLSDSNQLFDKDWRIKSPQ